MPTLSPTLLLALILRAMIRPLALTLLMLISACASRERPLAPVAAGPAAVAPVEPVEPLDPRIHPLSREEEELAR
jgi:hypothetical protein